MFGASKPFGTASTFGTSSFGNASTSFGQNTTSFGGKPPTANVFGNTSFGASTSTPMGGGLFGQSTPTTGTGLFGQPSTGFGAPASTSTGAFGGFGSTSASGGLFGNSTPATQTSGGLFGNTSTSAFGAPRPAFGGFGSSTPSTGLFGQNTSTGTGLFGASGGFSAPAASGTTIKFNPPTGTDTMLKNGSSTSIGTRHQCITCMKEYENKSLEELRMEDYQANRKGGTNAGIGFGTPTQQPSMFGTNTAVSTSGFSFGATTQTKPLFGTTGTTNTFGTGNLFGQPAQTQNTGLFGKSVGFGAPSTSAAPVFSFGASTGNSLFGQTNQQKPMFGQMNTNTGLFGNTATTQSTGFGTNTGFGFGAPNQQTTGLFGAKPTGFGTTNTTTTNTFSFGNTNNMSGGGLFGQKPAAPAFGTTTGFGTQSTGFGAFNATPSTNLFGQAKPATTGFGSGGNMFGSNIGNTFGTPSFSMGLGTNAGTGLFGATNANKAPGFSFGNTGTTGFNFGATNPSGTSFNFGQPSQVPSNDLNNSAVVQQIQQQVLAMVANPFGYSPLFKNTLTETSKESEVLKPTNPSAQKALLNDNQYKISLLPTAKIKPKPWSPATSGKLLFDGLEDEEPSLEKAAFLPKKSIKKLEIKQTKNHLPVTVTLSPNPSAKIDVSITYSMDKSSQSKSPLTIDVTNNTPKDVRSTSVKELVSPQQNMSSSLNSSSRSFAKDIEDSFVALFPNKQKASSINSIDSDILHDSSVNDTLNSSVQETSTSDFVHPTGITLKRSSYYTIPSLDELIPIMDANQNCNIKDFTVGRENYGKVTFPDVINVAGLNLDEIVFFRKKEIDVYPDDSKKPPVGEGLNRKAIITLENVWPKDKTSHTSIKDVDRIKKIGYLEKIEKCTSQLGATLIAYKPETGSWIFQVAHFSKYGLEDSDDEIEEGTLPPKTGPPQNIQNKTVIINPNNSIQMQEDPGISFALPDQEMETMNSQMQLNPLLDEHILNELTRVAKPIFNIDIDAKRMQGMKSTFFHEDMDDDLWAPEQYAKHDLAPFEKRDKSDKSSPFIKRQKQLNVENEQLSFLSIQNLLRDDEIAMISPLPVDPIITDKESDTNIGEQFKSLVSTNRVAKCPSKIFLKSFKDSYMYDKQHLLSDAAYFMGRSFRCGFTASGIFTTLSRDKKDTQLDMVKQILYNNQCVFRGGGPNFSVSLKTVSNDSYGEKLQEILIKALKIQLESSISTVEDGVPLFVSKCGVEPIYSLADFFKSELKNLDSYMSEVKFVQQCVNVWDLLFSLWGQVRGLEQQHSNSQYAEQMARREAFSRWLIHSTEQDLNKQISNIYQTSEYLTKIFLCLCGRRIVDAVKIAQQAHDFRLSLLLSQAEGSLIVRKLIQKQIENWSVNKAYEFMKYERKSLYMLLSGMLVYENVNCCRELDWKQALSLQLWYYCSPNASIQDAVKEYIASFQGTSSHGKYAMPPYPPYVDHFSAEKDSESSDIYDTCFHILKLYCDRSHRFDLLLMPETYTSDHLDYRLSWLLHLALLSVGFNVPEDLTTTLHSNFASQLESLHLWDWAVFVFLHHPDKERKTKEIKDILLRNVSLEQCEELNSKEKFLIESLFIPPNWIYEAKAIKAGTLGTKAEEAWFLLKAGCWSKSHNIVIKHLASDAIINENYEFLMKYLKELAQSDRSCTILEWVNGGQVYLDYINMCQVVKEILSQETSAYDLEKIMPEVQSLCLRLSNIPTTTLKDKLSVAEMAKKTATILRSIVILSANSPSVTTLCALVKNLPMPLDYQVPETKFLLHSLLNVKS